MIFTKSFSLCLFVLCSMTAYSQQYATVTSTEGWSITVTLQYKQMRITNPGENCKWGFNYVLDMDYTVSYDDEGGPRMWWLAAGSGCFSDRPGAVGIPEGIGLSGTITSPEKWANPQPDEKNCKQVDYSRFACNTVYLTLSGPGIPQQTVLMQRYEDIPQDDSGTPPGGNSSGGVGPAPGSGEEFQLPISLVDFRAAVSTTGINLNWETESEESNAYFVLERSHDARSWMPVTTIQGAGTTRETSAYSFRDADPMTGVNYYRLVQVDFSGETSNSPVISVEMEQPAFALEVYPNPVSDRLYVRSARAFEIFDLRGQQITASLTVAVRGQGGYVVDVSGLSRGIYVLRSGEDLRRFVRQ